MPVPVGYYYRPTTPPVHNQELVGNSHNRHASDSSTYSNDSSPWSAVTSTTSPTIDSPSRYQHGPALLPRIRSQDVVIEPPPTAGPHRHRRFLSNTRNPPSFVPYPPHQRPSVQHNVVEVSDRLAAVSSTHTSPVYASYDGSTLSSPVSITPSLRRRESGKHSRSGSASSVDEESLKRYGYPTYQQFSKYETHPQPSTMPITPATPNIMVYPPFARDSPAESAVTKSQEAPTHTQLVLPASPYGYGQVPSAQCSPVTLAHPTTSVCAQSTTLLSYLTSPTQAINLVRNVSVVPTRGLHDYFWWDIRNLRSWTGFSLETFNSIKGLTKLLKTAIPSHLTPPAVVQSNRLSPDSEAALVSLVQDIYAPRVNAALAVSQGPDHLSLYSAPIPRASATANSKNYGGPHFLANYSSDTEQTTSGLPRGRLVGIAKSFDRWNTGMRNEAPHRRVEYLNGLAHLQRCMREHSCRYGFIITEIELVCVRAGCDQGDDVPYFGFLEISAPIPTNISAGMATRSENQQTAYASPNSPTPSVDSSLASQSPPQHRGEYIHPHSLPPESEGLNVPMTASLALYFLLMLSKSVPLPSQPSSHLNVGGPGALTRQRTLNEAKDKWIPEPQIGEKRDAKRVRGWIWPHDAWHRREGGGVPRSRAVGVVPAAAKQKKWLET
ncbi:uncharacterized protein BDV17DRAFT_94668 [Aspergillus undulatus]|uniref:uncharacterized protein n=1 Tax=Aspergillus undulatus TaxID=1810928 RepID=UPI003CCD5DCC